MGVGGRRVRLRRWSPAGRERRGGLRRSERLGVDRDLGSIGTLALLAQRHTEPPPKPAERGTGRLAIRYPGMPALMIVMFSLGVVFAGVEVTVIATARESGQTAAAGIVLGLWSISSLARWVDHWRRSTAASAAHPAAGRVRGHLAAADAPVLRRLTGRDRRCASVRRRWGVPGAHRRLCAVGSPGARVRADPGPDVGVRLDWGGFALGSPEAGCWSTTSRSGPGSGWRMMAGFVATLAALLSMRSLLALIRRSRRVEGLSRRRAMV